MKTRHYRDLEIWQRAAVSIPSNIAEGHGRLTDKVFLHFLGQARGPIYEVETQIELSTDLKFMTASDATVLRADCQELSRMTMDSRKRYVKVPLHQTIKT